MPSSLLHSPADIIRTMLIDLSLGTAPSDSLTWPVYVSQEPSLPDNCITVYDTTGTDDGHTQPDGELQERHGIQVRIRSVDHPTGWTKSRAIAVALDEEVYRELVTIGASLYRVHAIARSPGPISLGKQTPDTKRDLFTINATVSVRQLI